MRARAHLRRTARLNFLPSPTTAFGGGNNGAASGFPSFAGVDTVGQRLQTGVNVSNAFVQWGGLTAGRMQSFFDFYADNDTWFGIGDSNVTTQALAYT